MWFTRQCQKQQALPRRDQWIFHVWDHGEFLIWRHRFHKGEWLTFEEIFSLELFSWENQSYSTPLSLFLDDFLNIHTHFFVILIRSLDIYLCLQERRWVKRRRFIAETEDTCNRSINYASPWEIKTCSRSQRIARFSANAECVRMYAS